MPAKRLLQSRMKLITEARIERRRSALAERSRQPAIRDQRSPYPENQILIEGRLHRSRVRNAQYRVGPFDRCRTPRHGAEPTLNRKTVVEIAAKPTLKTQLPAVIWS